MKICLYSPYIPKHFGGGEKYLFTVAQSLAQKDLVYVAVSSETALTPKQNLRLRKLYETFLGEPLHKNINFIASPLGSGAHFLEKLIWTKQFDVLYYATDGSLFFSLAKKNILHIQIPFTDHLSGFINRIKLANWQVKNANSQFTQSIVETNWRTHIDYVHYPAVVKESKINLDKKEKIILHVGRFFKQLHSKRQDVLVDIFSKLDAKNWKLVLIGSVEDQDYFREVQTMAQGKNIQIEIDVSRKQLLDWYKRASIYWHATGFEVNDRKYPEKVEHFGISTVEAMSYGCAPVVINKGGQKEIVVGDLSSLLWKTEQECAEITKTLMKDTKKRKLFQRKALERAHYFNQKRFDTTLWRMINEK